MSRKFKRMSRTLPAFYRPESNTMIGGLLKSWGISDDEIEVQIKNTKDQLFVKSAEGRFLDLLGNNVGVDRAPELGIDDGDFGNLIPVMSFFPKQVRKTVVSLLDVFWGPGFTRPNVNSGNEGPFNLGPATLAGGTANFTKNSRIVKGTGTSFTTQLAVGQFIKPNASSGTQYQKISAILSNTELELSFPWEGDVGIASTIEIGPVRELDYIVDGRIEKTIRLKPNAFEDITAATVTELVNFINNDVEHSPLITASEFLDPLAGSKLNLRTNTAGLQGSIEITGGSANIPSRLNFALEKQSETRASVFEINPNEIVVKIPSSVPVLRRVLEGSAHPRSTKTEIFSVDEVFNFNSLGASSTLEVTIDTVAYIVNFNHATDFNDPVRVTAEEVVQVINDQLMFLEAFTSCKSRDNFKKVGLRTTEGSSEYQITGGNANTILNLNPALQEDPILIQANFPSAYIFDPVGQLFTVTGTKSELSSSIQSGSISSTITVNDASSFPNQPGKFLLNFGRSKQEGPIAYNSRPNNSTLLIDASHIFQNEHLVDASVNFISDEPTIPRVTGDDFAVYVTGTEQAREAAQDLIKRLLASGVVIRFIIDFPEALFECVVKAPENIDDPDFRGSRTDLPPIVF